MSNFKVKLQKLINTSFLNDSMSYDTSDIKPKTKTKRLQRNLSASDLTSKKSKVNSNKDLSQNLSTSFVSSHLPKRPSIKVAQKLVVSQGYSTEDNSKTLQGIIRSCTPQDIHRHQQHNEPVLISHVNVNEPECALRNNDRMKRKMLWMNQKFQLKDPSLASLSGIKRLNHPIRGTNANLTVNRSEICSRSPNQKSRIGFEGEFREKIKRHLFEDTDSQVTIVNNTTNSHNLHQKTIKGPLMNKTKSSYYNCRVESEAEKYRKDFLKIMKSPDLSVLNK